MAEKTGIEWTDSTWNPVTGCTRVSPGCAHCYIETTFPFRTEGRIFDRVGDEETTGVRLHPERLERVPKGPRVFVCSLADLFHEDVPDYYVARVFDTMAQHPDRTFQVLTKRPERAREWFGGALSDQVTAVAQLRDRNPAAASLLDAATESWPLPNVWVGVSIENARYTWRADVLREIPAAVRFISAEPLLGSLFEDESSVQRSRRREASAEVVRGFIDDGHEPDDSSRYVREVESKLVSQHKRPLDLTGIDWLIVGGESGGRFARPMRPWWARELRDACLGPHACDRCRQVDPPETPHWAPCERGPAFFFKQHGSWIAYEPDVQQPFWKGQDGELIDGHALPVGLSEGEPVEGWWWPDPESEVIYRYAGAAPKSGGKLLDGREWCEFPQAEAVVA